MKSMKSFVGSLERSEIRSVLQTPGAKLKNIFVGVHNPNLPTNRLRSCLICRQIDYVRA